MAPTWQASSTRMLIPQVRGETSECRLEWRTLAAEPAGGPLAKPYFRAQHPRRDTSGDPAQSISFRIGRQTAPEVGRKVVGRGPGPKSRVLSLLLKI